MSPAALKALEKEPKASVIAKTSVGGAESPSLGSFIESSKGIDGAVWRASAASIELLKRQAIRKGLSAKIEWATPQEWLGRVPSTVSVKIPAVVQRRDQYDQESLAYAKKAMLSGKVLPVGFLDYSEMKGPYASHDFRHRMKTAMDLGIKKVPIVILGQKSVELNGKVKR